MAAEQIIVEGIGHSPLGASGSDRWLNCPGSIGLAAKHGITGSEAGPAAEEGTAGHEIMERCITPGSNKEPVDFIDTVVVVNKNEYVVDSKMVGHLDLCVNHVLTAVREASAEEGCEVLVFIEESMKHSKHKLMYGTVDCGIVRIYKERRKVKIKVKDLKYGSGIVVEPTKPQTKYYACLMVDHLITKGIIDSFDDVEEVELEIMQPRIPHPDGLIRSITMTGSELGFWFDEELVPGMAATEDPDAILQIGEWCVFCPAKTVCNAMSLAMIELSTAVPPEKQGGELLGRNMIKLRQLAKMLPDYEKVAYGKAMVGVDIFGHKLVPSKVNRVWNDRAKAALIEKYGEDAFSKEPLGPAKIEELPGGKAFVGQYAFKPNKGLTLAPLSDKRKPAKSLMDLDDDDPPAADL